MKNSIRNKKIYLLAFTLLVLIGCSEDYLNTSPTSYINYEDYKNSSAKNPRVLEGVLNGIYTNMINRGTGGTNSDRDFGHKSYDIYSDILSNDMAYTRNSYNTYHRIANYQVTTDYTKIENYRAWRYYYRLIKGANELIKGLGGNDANPSEKPIKHGLGQAKAVRAYAYFYLAQFFTKEYTSSDKILPLIISPDETSVKASSNEDVYNQIIKDLEDAIAFLEGFERKGKNKIDKNVAKGLLAYVYGAVNSPTSNQKAEILTREIINTGTYPIMTATQVGGGFNDLNTPSWMWGFDLTSDMGFGLGSWWGHVDLFTYSYQYGDIKAIDIDLYNKIPTNDVRKKQFYTNSRSRYYLAPLNKFYDADRVVDGERVVTNDYVFMRIAEIYLLNAEMAAKTNNPIQARKSLKAVVSKRVDDVTYIDSLSNEDLLKEVYLQTRIELWGEGKSYLAMKRFKSKIKRGSNHLYERGLEMNYNDNRLTLKVPLSEIQNNPFLE